MNRFQPDWHFTLDRDPSDRDSRTRAEKQQCGEDSSCYARLIAGGQPLVGIAEARLRAGLAAKVRSLARRGINGRVRHGLRARLDPVDANRQPTEPRSLDEPDLLLILTFKNWAALDGALAKSDAIAKQFEGSVKAANEAQYGRAKIRTVLGSSTMQVMNLK